MATQTQANVIHVPALMDGEKAIVPQFWLGKDVEYRQDRESNSLSAVGYNSQMTLPTLAELRRAFFDTKSGQSMAWSFDAKEKIYLPNRPDDWLSPEYRQSVLSKRGYGEWTSTFLKDGREAIENPANVVYRNGIWIAEGGKVTPVELPPDGWALEYDKPTGFPSRTSQQKKDAEKVFGDDTSYFYRTTSGVRAVLRDFALGDSGPFYVGAHYVPDDRPSDLGGRAEPVISMSMQKYQALTEAYQRVGDLLSRIKVQK